MSIIKEERYDMAGAIRYIKFSGYDEKFFWRKEKIKSIARDESILKYITKQWDFTSEEDAENDEYPLKIYEGN